MEGECVCVCQERKKKILCVRESGKGEKKRGGGAS